MTGSNRLKVAAAADVAPGEARVVEVGNRTLALFNVAGRFFAIDNRCTHRGGPLGEGPVDDQVVVCPWHGWRFDVTTGANVNNPAVKVDCFPVSVEDGAVYVDLG